MRPCYPGRFVYTYGYMDPFDAHSYLKMATLNTEQDSIYVKLFDDCTVSPRIKGHALKCENRMFWDQSKIEFSSFIRTCPNIRSLRAGHRFVEIYIGRWKDEIRVKSALNCYLLKFSEHSQSWPASITRHIKQLYHQYPLLLTCLKVRDN